MEANSEFEPAPRTVLTPAPSRRRAPWWLKLFVWILTCLVVPLALSYFLLAVAAGQGAALGSTEFTGTATVSNCAPFGREFNYVYRCHAVAHLPDDTPGARSSIASDQLIAPRPVTGDVDVVERCGGPSRGGLSGCDFYAVDQIRHVWWAWLAYLPLPVVAFASILIIFTVRARRDGTLPSRSQRLAARQAESGRRLRG